MILILIKTLFIQAIQHNIILIIRYRILQFYLYSNNLLYHSNLLIIQISSQKESLRTKPINIYLVRHGETNFNTDPVPRVRGRVQVPLNDIGIRHAQQSSEFLKNVKLDIIYYSSVERAKQTAEQILINQENCQFIENPLIIDISWGDWEGKTYQEAFGTSNEEEIDYFKHPDRMMIPNGESFYAVLDRVKQIIFDISNLDDKITNVCIVSHGAILNLLGCLIAESPLSHFWQFYMSGCGVSCIQLPDHWNHDLSNIKIKFWNANHFLK